MRQSQRPVETYLGRRAKCEGETVTETSKDISKQTVEHRDRANILRTKITDNICPDSFHPLFATRVLVAVPTLLNSLPTLLNSLPTTVKVI